MNLIQKFTTSLHEEGIVIAIQRTIRTIHIKIFLLLDKSFDWKYGTNTCKWVKLKNLTITGKNKEHGVEYQATTERSFTKLMSQLQLPNEQNNTFVDFGSGKGRVLLMASAYNFTKIVGVEFSSELCAIAKKNIQIYQTKKTIHMPIELIENDVLKYQFQGDENVLYLANPFNDEILKKLLLKVEESLAKDMRKILIIYNNPIFDTIMNSCNFIKFNKKYLLPGSTVITTYQNFN